MRAYDREPDPAVAVKAHPVRPEHGILALQRAAGNAAVASVLDVVGRGEGRPLPGEVRADMESRFGADFSDVRVHSGETAAASAAAVQALAYTVGNEIVLGANRSDMSTPDGRHTLAHELTHVLQQREGPVDGTPIGDGLSVSDPADRFEVAAEENARCLTG